MRIATSYLNGEIFQHLGHAETLKIYDVNGRGIQNTRVVKTEGFGHGNICELLKRHNVKMLICGGIGSGAKKLLKENGIELYAGVSVNSDQRVEELLLGKLEYNNDIQCTHHNHHDNNCEEHDCASEKGGCTGNK